MSDIDRTKTNPDLSDMAITDADDELTPPPVNVDEFNRRMWALRHVPAAMIKTVTRLDRIETTLVELHLLAENNRDRIVHLSGLDGKNGIVGTLAGRIAVLDDGAKTQSNRRWSVVLFVLGQIGAFIVGTLLAN